MVFKLRAAKLSFRSLTFITACCVKINSTRLPPVRRPLAASAIGTSR